MSLTRENYSGLQVTQLIRPDKKGYTVQDLGYIEIKLFFFSSLNYLQNQHKFAKCFADFQFTFFAEQDSPTSSPD